MVFLGLALSVGFSSLFAFLLLGFVLYRRWHRRVLGTLTDRSVCCETACGRVEYAVWGTEGPYVAVFHGVGMGFDAGGLYPDVVEAGYRVLCISRPGHLRTPVESGPTAEAQARLLNALLDVLGIESVAVLGVSGGGPMALAFAALHPERVWALLLEAAVTKRYRLDPTVRHSLMGRLFLHPRVQGPASWLVLMASKWAPRTVFLEFSTSLCVLSRSEVDANLGNAFEDPEERERFLAFMACTAPMDARGEGQELDIAILTQLPDDGLPLPSIGAPTWICHDSFDKDATVDHARQAIRLIPHAELNLLGEQRDGLGHLMFFGRQGEKLRRQRLEFLRRQRLPSHARSALRETATPT